MIAYAITTLLIFWLTFVFFCSVMKLRTVRDNGYLATAPMIVKAFAYLTLGIGLILDAMLNLLLSPILLELPHEWLTTDRVIRLKQFGNDWQRSCAKWLCKQLDALDEHHCS